MPSRKEKSLRRLQAQMIRRLGDMVASGVRVLCLLALSDSGVPCYDESVAKKLSALGIPCFGCTPQRLPELLEGALRGADLRTLAQKVRNHIEFCLLFQQ